MEDLNIIVETNQKPIVKQDAAAAFMVELCREEHEKNQKKTTETVEIKDKVLLSVEEAAELFGIGRTKIRSLSESENCPFVLWVGGHRKIKRDLFEDYIKKQYSV